MDFFINALSATRKMVAADFHLFARLKIFSLPDFQVFIQNDKNYRTKIFDVRKSVSADFQAVVTTKDRNLPLAKFVNDLCTARQISLPSDLLKVTNGNNPDMTFVRKDGKVMVNATEMAKKFGKRPVDWLQNSQTQSFVDELSKVRKSTLTDLVKVTKGGNNPGTWMHEDVAIEFARWLSSVFTEYNQKFSFFVLFNERRTRACTLGE